MPDSPHLANMEAVLLANGIKPNTLPFHLAWLNRYLKACLANQVSPLSVESARAFLLQFAQSGKAQFQVAQAEKVIRLYQRHFDAGGQLRSTPAVLDGEVSSWSQARQKLEEEIQLRQYSRKTLRAYRHWMVAFAEFCGEKPLSVITAREAKLFLTFLALERHVSASTQSQAFNALLFLFTHVLQREYSDLSDTPRAKTAKMVPTVLSRDEVSRLLVNLENPHRLLAKILYGCGLRLSEGVALRVQDLDFGYHRVVVHSGKGGKSRNIPMPERMIEELREHLLRVRARFEEDRTMGYGGAFLPGRLQDKLPKASLEWGWYWVFPATRLVELPDGRRLRFHMHETGFQKAIRSAVDKAGISKRASSHTLRHSYATHLLQMGYDIRTIQDLLGHRDLDTTMIYTHTVQALNNSVVSPIDRMDFGFAGGDPTFTPQFQNQPPKEEIAAFHPHRRGNKRSYG